jgi:hypothetical protein
VRTFWFWLCVVLVFINFGLFVMTKELPEWRSYHLTMLGVAAIGAVANYFLGKPKLPK